MIHSEEIRVDVLRNGAVLTKIRTDGKPRIRMRSGAEIKSSMSGVYAPNDLIDWERDELRPVLIRDGMEHPLGIFVPATVTPSRSNGLRRINVEAYDRCWSVQSTRAENLVHLAAGTNYIDAVKGLLATAGIALVLATPSTETLRMDREDWAVGTDYLTIVNQLLDEINYKALYFNAAGFAVLEPEQTVSAENIRRTYNAANSRCMLHRDLSYKLDLYNAPNVFICVCSNPDGTGPMVAVAENNNPASPLSILRRGRRIAKTYKLRNIASQEAMEKYAQLVCQDGMMLGTTVSISTAIMPGCGPDDIVALVHPDMEGVCRETEWQMELGPGGTMTHKLEKAVMQI